MCELILHTPRHQINDGEEFTPESLGLKKAILHSLRSLKLFSGEIL
ncbi:hypothetical protein [Helicobacter marmotae]|nr:hypothetical protein [Helicobacter marmotae]